MITAVFFDLFGTLVDNFPVSKFHACLAAMADTLGVERTAFIGAWTSRSMRDKRMVGASPSPETFIASLCQMLGGRPQQEQILAARELRLAYTRENLAPRPGAVDVLTQLKARAYRLGLISNCTWEVPALWAGTPFASLFEQPVFSCSVGMKKPNPAIFYLACERLAVEPEDALFIGDGESNELIGASRVGLNTIHICMPYERETVMRRESVRQWQGPCIEALEEVLEYPGMAKAHL